MQPENGLPEMKSAMARCRWHFISVAIFSVFVNLLMLTGPLFMLQVYDRVLSSRSEATLVALLVLVTGLFAMMGLLEFVRGRVLARAGARFQSLLDSRVMIAVLRRSVQPAERAKPNTAARDLDSVRQLLSGPAPFALFDMPWAPIFIAVIFLFHPFLGWISVFGAMILVVLTLMNQLRSREPAAESQRATSEAENLGEALRQNAEAVQGLGMREVGLARWLKLRQEALSRQVVASDRTAGYTSSSKSLRFYLQSLMLAAGAWLVLQQEISAGMMIAASIMLGRALAPVEQAIGQWGLAQRAARGWAALIELLEKTPPEIEKTALPAPKGFIDVQGITVVAPGDNHPVLRSISFKVEPGTALGVIGPSGAGKTTLAKILVGIWRPAAGKVRIDGAALDQWPEDKLGVHMGYLPQEIGLMSGTVAENIARMSEQRDDAEVVAAAQRAGAHDILLSLPQGYDTQIGAGGQRLSGGQRQRVALARALYSDPPVLVLDEPNANLDAPGEQALVDAIRDAKSRGKTVIIMAHRPSAIAACDQLLMIDKGLQVDFGPRDEVLKKRTKNYAQLPGVQATAPKPAAAAQATQQQVRMGALDALLAEGGVAKRATPASLAQTLPHAPAAAPQAPASGTPVAETEPDKEVEPASAEAGTEPHTPATAIDAAVSSESTEKTENAKAGAGQVPPMAAAQADSSEAAPDEADEAVSGAPVSPDTNLDRWYAMSSARRFDDASESDAEPDGADAPPEAESEDEGDLPLLQLPLSRLILTEPDPDAADRPLADLDATEPGPDGEDEAPDERPGFAERPTRYFSVFPSLGDHLTDDPDPDPIPAGGEAQADAGPGEDDRVTAEIEPADLRATILAGNPAEPDRRAEAQPAPAVENTQADPPPGPKSAGAEPDKPEAAATPEPGDAKAAAPDAADDKGGAENTRDAGDAEGVKDTPASTSGTANGPDSENTPSRAARTSTAKSPARGAAKTSKSRARARRRRASSGKATGDES